MNNREKNGSGPTLLFLIESAGQFHHFLRWHAPARRAGYRVLFMTARWSDAMRARQKGIACCQVYGSGDEQLESDLNGVGELENGTFTFAQAQRYGAAFTSGAESIMRSSDGGTVVLWGGGDTVASRALLAAAVRNGWRYLFIDRGNLPGTMIADPWGMNFDSYLARHPELLDSDSDLSSIDRMRAVLTSKKKTDIQSSLTHRNWLIAADAIASLLRGIPFRGPILPRMESPTPKGWFFGGDHPGSRIVLMPLNHSFELQKFQGGIGFVREQMAAAQQCAAEHSVPVVITLHPLERSGELYRELTMLRKEHRFSIHPGPSSALLERAEAVVASNTSVVLEALVLGIPVVHVGRSLFRGFDERRLSAYLTHYLLPIDPNAQASFTDGELCSILERVEWR